RSGGKSAPAERQIADALDRVARKLGADAGGAKGDTRGETQQLAGNLDEVRDARDRIARLERQMRDAQRAAGNQASGGDGASPSGAAQSGSEGKHGLRPSQGGGQGGGDVARLQQQLN